MTSLRNLLRHPVRTTLAIAGIMVTTAMLLDMVLLAGGIERSFARLLLGRGFQIRVSPRGTLPFDTEATLPGSRTVLATITADTGIAEAGRLLGTAVYARGADSLTTLFGYGVDPAAQGNFELLRGDPLTPGDTSGILLSEPAVIRLGAGIGDTITLVSRLDPQVAVAGAARRLVVRGIARFLYDYRGQPSIAVEVSVLQSLAGLRAQDRVSALVVRARNDAGAEAATTRLRAALPSLDVNSVTDMVARFRDRLVYFRQLSYILGSISLVVTVLLVGTLMTITVHERLGEIATLRAIGVSQATIVRGVMAEGTMLTVTGGGLGIFLGLVTARYLDRILTSFPGLPAAISFFVPDPDRLLLAALVLIATGILAGIWPAILAARAPIAATLRAEAT